MTSVLTDLASLVTWLFTQIGSILTSLVSNDYFLVVILLAVIPVVIGIVLRVFRSFGLKRGGRRRR